MFRAHTGRARLFLKAARPGQARAYYRSAAFVLLPFDEMDNFDRGGLACRANVLDASPLRGMAWPTPDGASPDRLQRPYRSVPALDNPPHERQAVASALARSASAVTLSNELTHPATSSSRLCALRHRRRKGPTGGVVLCRPGLRDRASSTLVPVDSKLARRQDAVQPKSYDLEPMAGLIQPPPIGLFGVAGERAQRLEELVAELRSCGELPRSGSRLAHALATSCVMRRIVEPPARSLAPLPNDQASAVRCGPALAPAL